MEEYKVYLADIKEVGIGHARLGFEPFTCQSGRFMIAGYIDYGTRIEQYVDCICSKEKQDCNTLKAILGYHDKKQWLKTKQGDGHKILNDILEAMVDSKKKEARIPFRISTLDDRFSLKNIKSNLGMLGSKVKFKSIQKDYFILKIILPHEKSRYERFCEKLSKIK